MQDIGNSAVGVHVQMNILGRFDLRVGGRPLPELSAKLRNVLCFLVLHRDRRVPQAELIEKFWGDETQSDPLSALKMLILRLRRVLQPLLGEGIPPIISFRGAYQWNPEVTCIVDAEEFEKLCVSAASPELKTGDRISLYARALELYQGDAMLGRENLSWSAPLIFWYNSKYISAAKEYAELLKETGEFERIIEVCVNALNAEPTNEGLYILLIQALLQRKRQADAMKYYKNAVEILYRDLGVRPSRELQELYPLIQIGHPVWSADLDSVIAIMRSPSEHKTAFLCDFELFKSIYQLEVRRAPRIGGCLHIAMISVTGKDGAALSEKTVSVVMDRVEQGVVRSLRQSDVVARYGKHQFLIMLPFATLEDCSAIMERIKRVCNPNGQLGLSYQIRGLELA